MNDFNMDNNVIISKKDYKICDNENYFTCDKNIAYAITTLNKKGYITKSSCEGHIDFSWHEINNCDLDLLEGAKKDKRFIVLRVNKNGFDYLTPNMLATIYISFVKNYDFINLPEGFELENDFGCIIRKTIWYNHKDKRRTIKDLENEKKKYIEILNKWVEELPDLN